MLEPYCEAVDYQCRLQLTYSDVEKSHREKRAAVQDLHLHRSSSISFRRVLFSSLKVNAVHSILAFHFKPAFFFAFSLVFFCQFLFVLLIDDLLQTNHSGLIKCKTNTKHELLLNVILPCLLKT